MIYIYIYISNPGLPCHETSSPNFCSLPSDGNPRLSIEGSARQLDPEVDCARAATRPGKIGTAVIEKQQKHELQRDQKKR